MQAVILAAGKSTRTYPLTLTKPKPLLKMANETIIEHSLNQLKGLAEEVIIVVGYKGEMIESFIGKKFGKIKISYVAQERPMGNADALKSAKKYIKGRFILMFGDDLYSGKDIGNMVKYKNAILAQKVLNPQCFGVLKIDKNIFIEVVEKPKEFISDLVNVGCFVFEKKIFDYLEAVNLSQRNEYELTDAYNLMAKDEEINVVEVKDYWLPTGYPWNLLEANEFLMNRIKSKIEKGAKVEKGATLKGKIIIGKGSLIKSGSYVEGPVAIGKDCVIGPNCYLRAGTVIGNNSHISQAVEIKNSIIGDNTNVAHLSYVGDSIIGDNCNLAAGTITANLRHDGKNVKCKVKEEVKDTGRKKVGVIMGDNCKTGIHTSFYPGVKIDPGICTLPGDVIGRDMVNT